MYKRILVAYNGTLESRNALHECIHLTRNVQSEVHLLMIVKPPISTVNMVADFAYPITDYEDPSFDEKQKESQLKLDDGYQQLETAGITATKHLEIGEPVEVIERLAKDLDINLVIVGHSKKKSRTLRWWAGTTDAKLTEKIQCRVDSTTKCNFEQLGKEAKDVLVSKASRPPSQSSHDLSTP